MFLLLLLLSGANAYSVNRYYGYHGISGLKNATSFFVHYGRDILDSELNHYDLANLSSSLTYMGSLLGAQGGRLYPPVLGLNNIVKVNGNSDEKQKTKVLNNSPGGAVLSHDPNAKLPSSFTICSTIMATSIYPNDAFPFVWVVGQNGIPVLGLIISVLMEGDNIVTTYFWKQRTDLENNEKKFHAFSKQWIKCCAALNSTSGVYQIIVDGIFVSNGTLSQSHWANFPQNLSGKVVIGAYEMYGHWPSARNKVTNLNIFSKAHPVSWMRSTTLGGECVEDGDYLAWKDMQWTLHGQAAFERVDLEQTCMAEPVLDVFNVEMDQLSCKRLCENLGSRAPSVVTVNDWLIVKRFFERYDNFAIWVSISDEEEEGVWRDHYTGQIMNHSKAWYPWAPNMGRNENHAILGKTTSGLIGLGTLPRKKVFFKYAIHHPFLLPLFKI